jgi:hypothetical protein
MSVKIHSDNAYDNSELKFLQVAYDTALAQLGMDANCSARQHEALARTIMRIAARNENDAPELAHRAAALMEKCIRGAACPALGCRLKQLPLSLSPHRIFSPSLVTL